MERQEMIEILEEIARDERNQGARVSALRVLEEWRKQEEAKQQAEARTSEFDQLYEHAPRRPWLQVKDGGKK
jgi:hypothetical protein